MELLKAIFGPSDSYALIQKQPSRGVLRKKCSGNMLQIYSRTPMLTCNFNEAALQLY